jgi:RNA polymerase sigma factor (sigma-70 family)
LLDSLRGGDESARDALLEHSLNHLRHLARRMFRTSWDWRRIDQTDDVLQKAMLRLYAALAHVRPPDVLSFYGLAARQIRRVLRDLARDAAKARVVDYRADPPDAEDPYGEPTDLAEWAEFHEKIEGLPEQERETFDLLLYEGLTQKQAASALQTSVRTVKRRWQRARLSLAHALHGDWPKV